MLLFFWLLFVSMLEKAFFLRFRVRNLLAASPLQAIEKNLTHAGTTKLFLLIICQTLGFGIIQNKMHAELITVVYA